MTRAGAALVVGAVVTVLHAWWLTYYADPGIQHWPNGTRAWSSNPKAEARWWAGEFVAWYPMAPSPFLFRAIADDVNSRYWTGWNHDGAGLTYVKWYALWEGGEYSEDSGEPWTVLRDHGRFPLRYREEVLAPPHGSRAARPRDPTFPRDETTDGADILAGWPLRTMRASFDPDPPPADGSGWRDAHPMVYYAPAEGTIDLRGTLRGGARTRGILPYGLPARPIWPNFAIVAGVWVVVAWWVMLALALAWRFGVRRSLAVSRVRRGLCPHCRYRVEGLDCCPECGWKRGRPTEPLGARGEARALQ